MGACDADDKVEICSSAADPVFVSNVAGGGAGLTDAELRATPLPVVVRSETSGGLSIFRSLDVDEDATDGIVKASAGQLYGYYLYNNAATVRFVKIYNKATAATQADTPILTIPLPANSGANLLADQGLPFAAGIGIRATTGVADNDTGAPSANDVIANLFYK